MESDIKLYPVVQMMTGTTPNGGGTWKWLLHGLDQGILRRNIPIMVQALHFKDYSMSPAALRRWREKPLREHYNGGLRTVGDYKLNYTGEIFFDSGGYVFMLGAPEGLDRFGFVGDKLQEKLLQLKLDLGADKVVSLDYPIPPGLEPRATRRRLDDTFNNALKTARILKTLPVKRRPGLVLPVHGASARQAGMFTRKLLSTLEAECLTEVVFGLGLGSMVPLRRHHRTAEIIAYIKAVHRAAPDIPLHVFGVTGLLIPFLMQVGATSFDSSNYIQKARTLKYVLPGYKDTTLRQLDDYPCDCRVCMSRQATEDRKIIDADKGDVEIGLKSQVYAAIALHNLQQDFDILERSKLQQSNGTLGEYVKELSYRYPRMRPLLEGKVQKVASVIKEPVNDPNAFNLKRRRYRPSRPVLLLLPCTGDKPYTSAHSYKYLWNKLLGTIGDGVEALEVVFISGLYGPVPSAYVEEKSILQYDFLLRSSDKIAQQRVRERLMWFLEHHRENFTARIAYLASPAYRKVAKGLPVELLPESNVSRYSHYQNINITRLIQNIQELIKVPSIMQQ